jgi:PAS domain S-box-containing protein
MENTPLILTLALVFLMISGIMMLTLSVVSFLRHRTKAATSYAGLCLSIAVYTLFYALELISPDLETALIWSAVQYFGISLIPVFALLFCLEYTGMQQRTPTWQWISLLIIPVVIILSKLTDSSFGLIYKEVVAREENGILILDITPGALYYFNIFYNNFVVLIALILILLRLYYGTGRAIRKHLKLLIWGLLAPWLAHITYQIGISPSGMDLSPFGFAVTALLFGYSFFFSSMFKIKHLMYETLFNHISDLILVTDQEGVIVDMNEAAGETFFDQRTPLFGTHIGTLSFGKQASAFFSDKAALSVVTELKTTKGLRTFDIRQRHINEPSVRFSGMVYTLHDITDIKTAEQALHDKTRELEDYFSNSLDMLCILDEKGNILHTNPEWYRTLGYTVEQLHNKNIAEFLPDEERDSFMRSMESGSNSDQRVEYIGRFQAMDKGIRFLEWRISKRGGLSYASIRDMTSREHEKRVLRRLIGYTADLLRAPVNTMDYHWIAEQFLDLSGARAVFLNLYDRVDDKLTITAVAHATGTLLPEEAREGMAFPLQAIWVSLPEFRDYNSQEAEPFVSIEKEWVLSQNQHPFWQIVYQTILATDPKELKLCLISNEESITGSFLYFGSGEESAFQENLMALFIRHTGLFLSGKEAERAGLHERAYFETLFESSPGGLVILDHHDRILRCNQEFMRMFGYDLKEIEGQAINDVIVPEHLKEEGNRMTESVAQGTDIMHETVRQSKNGDLINVSILGKPVFIDGKHLIYGIYIDIGELIQTRQMLLRRQKELQHTLKAQRLISQIALTLNSVTDFSERVTRVLGLIGSELDISRVYVFENSPEVSSTSNTFEWVAPHAIPQIQNLQTIPYSSLKAFHEQLSTHGMIVSGDMEDLDGVTKNFLRNQQIEATAICALYVRTRYFGFIGYDECRGSREWSFTEQELLRTVGAVISMAFERREIELKMLEERDRANQANLAKSEFLANMSHEIRTPMNAILGFSETLYEQLTESDQRGMLQSVLSSGRSLLSLLNDILDLSKIESGRIEIAFRPFDLHHLVKEVVTLFYERAERRGIKLLYDPPEQLPARIILDEVRLRQVLFNLVGNAVKFTNRGYVRVTIATELLKNGNHDITISVEDTGIGIPSDQQELIFDPFIQVSKRTNREYEGTGLGLSISKRLVEQMSGRLQVSSEEGAGSIFSIILADIAIEAGVTDTDSAVGHREVVRFRETTVLIIDDVTSNLMVMQRFLKSFGINTLTAENGAKGLELLNENRPDLIITDIRMPSMDGFALASVIKNNPMSHKIPVLAYTAALVELKASDKTHVFDGVIMKPVIKEDLIRELKRFIPVADQFSNKHKIVSEDILVKEITIEDITNPSELREVLLQQYIPQWEILRNQLVLFKIEAFAKELIMLSKKHNFAFLEAYGDRMVQEVQNIDLDQILYVLDQFPRIMSALDNV